MEKKINPDLSLLQLQLHHTTEVFQRVNENRTHLREWLPWVDSTKIAEDIRKFIESSLKQHEEGRGVTYGIWFKDRLVGVISLAEINLSHKHARLGYWLSEDAQGKGIMTQTVGSILDHAFNALNLHKVTIRAAVGNIKSQAIAERLGFTFEGTLRDDEWLYDHFVDLKVYSLLEDEFRAR